MNLKTSLAFVGLLTTTGIALLGGVTPASATTTTAVTSTAPANAADSSGAYAGTHTETAITTAAKETPRQKADRLAKPCLVKGKVTRAEIVCIAKSQVGMKEWGNNCNPYGWCDQWCGMFGQWVMKKAGAKYPKGYAAAASWGKWTKIKTPRPGDVAVRSDGQHVEIVVKVFKKNGKTIIASVGGNSGNKVTYHPDNSYARWTYHKNPSV
jgi:uncharacterized protein (TIGR02594 family)